jgi:hypothetical protein
VYQFAEDAPLRTLPGPVARAVWYNTVPILSAMPISAASDPKQAIGRAPERLNLDERIALVGKCIALEIYTPEALPLRRIEAIGDSVEECVRQLTARGHDAARFEFSRLGPPY